MMTMAEKMPPTINMVKPHNANPSSRRCIHCRRRILRTILRSISSRVSDMTPVFIIRRRLKLHLVRHMLQYLF